MWCALSSVAFNPDEITHADDASEALVASLNKYGRVEPRYMASLTGTTVEGILGELKVSSGFIIANLQ